jgi:hypothetical protein
MRTGRRTAKRVLQARLLIVPATLLAAIAGCGEEVHVVPLTAAEQELTYVALAYTDAHERLGRGPKDADELKPYLKPFGDPEDLLVSPNDGEPYVVVWKANPVGGPGEYMGMFPILAYEQKGTGGKRAVTDVRGRPLTVPEEDMEKLKFLRGHKPGKS